MRGIIAIGLILLSVLNLQAQVWTPLNGPNGAYVNSIEVSSTGVIFISTISGNIYRSLDLGVSWSKVYNGNGDFWYDLKIDAAGKVYAIGASLLISSDGVSWTQKSLPSGTYSNWIEKDPVNGYLYFYSYTDKKVYKSIDDGTNWSIVFNSTSSIYSIVCTSSGKVLLSESTTGIWKSTSGDLGTYTQSNSGLLSLDISEMILDGSGNLVAIDNSNFYYSTQASEGGTWFKKNPGTATVSSGHLFRNPSGTVFYANTSNKLLQFNCCAGWTESTLNYPPYYYIELICSPATNVLTVGSNGGPVSRSTDNGIAWTDASTGITNPEVNDLEVTTTGRVLVGGAAGIYSSADNGTTFNAVSSNYNYTLFEAPSASILAACQGSVVLSRSIDGGATFTDITSPAPPAMYTIDASGSTLFGASDSKIYYSTDNGSNWTQLVVTGISANRVTGGGYYSSDFQKYFKVDNLNNLYWLMRIQSTSTFELYKIAYPSGVATQITNVPDAITYLGLEEYNNVIYTVTTASGAKVYYSSDQGTNWTYKTLPSSGDFVITSNGYWFTGAPQSLYYSKDNGTTWTNISNSASAPYEMRSVDMNSSGIAFFLSRFNVPLISNSSLFLNPEPTSYPAFTATAAGTNQINLAFSAASTITNATGFIILRRQDGNNPTGAGINDGAAAPATPASGTSLITTILNTATTSYSDTGLSPGVQYNYAIIPYGYDGGSAQSYNYRTAASIPTANALTLSLEPTSHPAAFTATVSGTNQINLSFSAGNTITNASGYIILRRQDGTNPTNAGINDGATPPATPTAGTVLVATVTSTSATTYNDASVSPGVQYNYAIVPYGFNGSNAQTYNYRTVATIPTGNAFTYSLEPVGHAATFTATAAGTNQINLSFSAGSTITNALGYIILRRQDGTDPSGTGINDGAIAPATPTAGTTLIAAITGTATTAYNDASVSPGIQYNYAIIPYGYNGSNAQTYNYRTAATIPAANAATLSLEPASHASAFTATAVGTNQINLTFSAASTIANASGYIVIRRQDGTDPTNAGINDGTAPPVTPAAGTTLIATITSTVATTYNDVSVSQGIQYNYAILPYGYNGSNAQTYNYRTAATIPIAGPVDTSPPTLSTLSPADNSTSVSFNSNLVLTFNEPVQKGSGNILIKKSSDNSIVQTIDVIGSNLTISNSTLTIDPSTDLAASMDFYINIPATAVKDLSGNSFAGFTDATTWNFSTAATADVTPPVVSSFSPADNATAVVLISNLGVTFNESIQKGTGNILIKKSSDNSVVQTIDVTGSNVTISSAVLTIDPAIDFTVGTDLYINVPSTAVKDLAGNSFAGILDATTWNFSTATLSDTTPPQVISNATLNTIAPNTAISVSANFQDTGTGIASAKIQYRPISGPIPNTIITSDMTNSSGTTYQFSIPSTAVTELGVEYKFLLTDGAGNDNSASQTLYKTKIDHSTGLAIPYSSPGRNATNYRIFAIPLELTSKSLNSVIGDELGDYDPTQWTAYRWEGGPNYVELNGNTQIEVGKGYWLLTPISTALNSGAGKTPDASTSSPVRIALKSGWNQVGNPYNFDISWADVLTANSTQAPNLGNNSKIRVFRGAASDVDELQKFEGGFVKNTSTSDLTIDIPVAKNLSINGRKSQQDHRLKNGLDQPEWEILFDLNQGMTEYNLGGLGMRPDAAIGFDFHDDFNLPRFIEYLEIKFPKERVGMSYTKDIVPTSENFVWEFRVESNLNEEKISIGWDNSYFGAAREIYLLDVAEYRILDMRAQDRYNFSHSASKEFKVVYGNPDFVKRELVPNRIVLQEPFPNPFTDRVSIEFGLPKESVTNPAEIGIFNVMGAKVSSVNTPQQEGMGKWIWESETSPSGLYFVSLRLGDQCVTKKLLKR